MIGKEIQSYIAYYLSTYSDPFFEGSKLTQDSREIFTVYKTMIKEYKEERSQIDEKALSVLEYTNNLLKSKPDLGNEWEREFISKMFGLLKSGYKLTEKQRFRVNSIVKKVEKELGISLTFS